MIRARLTDRHGVLVGYCDVPELPPSAKDLPALPEVISLRRFDRGAPEGRTFIHTGLPDNALTRERSIPSYREAIFEWAENFRLDPKGGAA